MPLQETSGAASYDAFGGGPPFEPVYIESVFSTWLYTGNGSTQTITNGIDLSTKGGLVWIKNRSSAYTHVLVDTNRGTDKVLCSNNTNAEQTGDPGFVTQFNSNGFAIGDQARVNLSSSNFASWTFRKQPKFFDVVTYTGDGNYSTDTPAPYGRAIAHSLASRPGFIVIKATSTTSEWYVAARQNDTYWIGSNGSGTNAFRLNGTGAGSQNLWSTKPMADASVFYPAQIGAGGSSGTTNDNGVTYVAYLFAHDAGGFGLTGTDNVISCGSYVGTSANFVDVNLGYEPQWFMVKKASDAGPWYIIDNMRDMSYSGTSNLQANASNAEQATVPQVIPSATGISLGYSGGGSSYNVNGVTYIYIAIRRGPMKTPTSGTSVFNAVLQNSTANQQVTTNFVVDLLLGKPPANSPSNIWWVDRLRGSASDDSKLLTSANTDAEGSSSPYGIGFQNNNGVNDNYFYGSSTIYWAFRRAPGFFDEVCYTGTGSATTFNHNLGVVPELMIVKRRDTTSNWTVYSATLANTEYIFLNSNGTKLTGTTRWNSTTPTSSVFTVGTDTGVNDSGGTYVAYLFASVAGVSKIGSYTGNGTSQTIDCGFTGGTRFVLIKKTSGNGNWWVWDSARGIVAGNDPYLALNTTSAEVTTRDSVDTDSSGFIVNDDAGTGINVNGDTYLFLAIA